MSRVLPAKLKANIWCVRSPARDRLAQPTVLGQIEKLPTRRWIAATNSGVPVGDIHGSKKEAAEALAAALGCDAPFMENLRPSSRFLEGA